MLRCCYCCCCVLLIWLQVWLDQADGQVLTEGEEVTLMDWGNAIIKVGAETVAKSTWDRIHHVPFLCLAVGVDWVTAGSVWCSQRYVQLAGCMSCHTRVCGVTLGDLWYCWMPADDHIALIGDAAGLGWLQWSTKKSDTEGIHFHAHCCCHCCCWFHGCSLCRAFMTACLSAIVSSRQASVFVPSVA
jgi:hypothetical protein